MIALGHIEGNATSLEKTKTKTKTIPSSYTCYKLLLSVNRDGKLNALNSPAPEALLELCSCNCESDCQKRYCVYNKNSLLYIEMCGCRDNCQNLQSNSDRPLETESE